MKKLLSLLLLTIFSVSFSFATEPQNEFEFNQDEISQEFGKLNQIESYVQKNDVTLDELKAEKADLVAGIELNNDATAALSAGDLPGGIPAFWWGCVLAVLGVVLVYVLTDQDKDQTKKALIGCLVFAGAWVVYYVVIVAIIGRSFWF